MWNDAEGPGSLHSYDYVVINSSAGKDSQTALRRVVQIADQQGYPRGRLVVVHADLGRIEWPGTRELAERQAQHYKLRFEVECYRSRTGEEIDLLEYIRRRGKWPSSTNRYCTSDFKRGPCSRLFTRLHRELVDGTGRSARQCRCHMLNVFGFRADESPARAKRPKFTRNERLCTTSRKVWDWLPIHNWTEQQVWEDIRSSGVPYHPAYDKGMPRLSCRFCIFAPKAALMIAGRENPELLDEYVLLEQQMGHTFQHKKPIGDVADALHRGETADAAELDGAWNM